MKSKILIICIACLVVTSLRGEAATERQLTQEISKSMFNVMQLEKQLQAEKIKQATMEGMLIERKQVNKEVKRMEENKEQVAPETGEVKKPAEEVTPEAKPEEVTPEAKPEVGEGEQAKPESAPATEEAAPAEEVKPEGSEEAPKEEAKTEE